VKNEDRALAAADSLYAFIYIFLSLARRTRRRTEQRANEEEKA
jgi:hypothetical protein